MKVGVVIVAAGRGTRAGGDVPKQWRRLAGCTVVEHAMRAFSTHPRVAQLVLVVHPDDLDARPWPKVPEAVVVTGGALRSDSVRSGLDALSPDIDTVLIHDAARPCVSTPVIDGVLGALESTPAAAPAVPVVDALWSGSEGMITKTVDRAGLFRAQTPQGFHRHAIQRAHDMHAGDAADDVEVALRAGLDVAITVGHDDNFKITGPEDFARAEAILRARHGY